MVRLGIFAKTFAGASLDEVLAKLAARGFQEAHFSFACAGIEPLPHRITGEKCREIRRGFSVHGLRMSGISATFNAIHPDAELRSELTERACQLIDRCPDLACNLVALCTGTRDPDDMWKAHPRTQEAESWNDLCRTLAILLRHAERQHVVLGIEPEHNNVINSAAQARRLLDYFSSPHLKIIIDPANLVEVSKLSEIESVLDEAFSALGSDIVAAHAKDISRYGQGFQAAGDGLLDWRSYVGRLVKLNFTGPLLLHGLHESEVDSSKTFLDGIIKELSLAG